MRRSWEFVKNAKRGDLICHINIITKHAKKFLARIKNSILNGIHYAADGTVYVTDRHHARIRNTQFQGADALHAKTGAPISGRI